MSRDSLRTLLQSKTMLARWAALSLSVIFGLAGCSGETSAPGNRVTTITHSEGEGSGDGNAAEAGAGQMAQTVFDIFDLQRLDLETEAQAGIQDVNRLAANFAPGAALAEPVPPALIKQFKPAELERLTAKRFPNSDEDHFRSAMLFRTLAEHAVGEADTSRKQVLNLFDFVVTTVDLVPTDKSLPLTAYEVCLTGQGTAQDRAWIFAGLLRQLKIDAVLLSPAKSAAPDSFLVAVLLREDGKDLIFLFDPQRGTALRVGGKLEGELATLDQAVADAAVLAPLTGADGQPVWTVESLATAKVSLMGSLPLWSSRMAQLQGQFTGSRALVLSDPLIDVDNPDGGAKIPGSVARITAANGGKWKDAEKLSPWMHPEAVAARRAALDAAGNEAIELLLGARLCPIRTERNEKGLELNDPNTNFVRMLTPSRLEWRARLSHLAGDHAKAITEYSQVRMGSKYPEHTRLDPKIRKFHDRAMEDVRYLIGLCQFQQAKSKEALNTFEKYLLAYPEGVWLHAALRRKAECQADQGFHAEAVKTLQQLPAEEQKTAWVKQRIESWSKPK